MSNNFFADLFYLPHPENSGKLENIRISAIQMSLPSLQKPVAQSATLSYNIKPWKENPLSTSERKKNSRVRQSVASIAYDEITERITSGDFGARQRLTEAQLMRELNVSRGAVREAISRLAADGLLDIELNKGAIVRAISRQDLADFLQVRALFESFAARRAAERINEPGAREVAQEVLEHCRKLEKTPSNATMVDNDTIYHDALMDLSGNALMAAEWRRMHRSRYRLGFLLSLDSEQVVGTVSPHREIFEPIQEGDADRAAALEGKNVRLVNSRIQRLDNQTFERIFNSQTSGDVVDLVA